MKLLKPAIFLAFAFLTLPARAQDDGQSAAADSDTAAEAQEAKSDDSVGKPLADRIKAVSRKFVLKKNRFELTTSAGLSVNDAFFRNYVLQLDGTYHIAESFAVELRLGLPFFGQALGPVDFLRGEYDTLTNIVRPAYYGHLSAIFTPLYGKVSMFSEWIWHYDLYLAAGVGVTGIGILSGANLDMAALGHMPSMNVGIGMRSFITKWMSVHVDARDYIYPSVTEGLSNMQNLLIISVGAGFFFPFDFDYEYEGYKVVS